MLVHTVNFWLKKDLSSKEIALFEKGVSSLQNIEVVKYFSVGTPASTDRPTIDRTYSYSLLTVFEGMPGHDVYQTHQIHLQFLADCKHLWDRVLIYDAESI